MKPCQTARLYSGMFGPTTARTAVSSSGPTVNCGNDADDKACEHEKLGRKAHEKGRLAGVRGRSVRRRTKEYIAYEAQRIRDRKHARDRDDVRQRLIYERVIMNLYGLREEHLL